MAFQAPNNKIVGQLSVGVDTINAGDVNYLAQYGGNRNDFQAIGIQNLSTGDAAFSDIILSADNDTQGLAGHFVDMGIAGSGVVSTSAALGIIKSVSVTAGGTGYTVGDQLTLSTGDANATVVVLVAAGGIVSSVQVVDNGTNYTAGTKATTGGTGTGCTINVLTLYDFTIGVANDGYFYVSGGHLAIGTDDTAAGKVIRFHTGGQSSTNERARIDNTGVIVMPVTAVPAGGTAATGLRFSSTANLGIFFGSGVPTLSAAQGSLYIRTNGSTTATRMYVNTNGTTGWTAVTTAS